MPIPFACPNCDLETLVDDEYEGQTGVCAGCGKKITVPYVPTGQPLGSDEIVVGISAAKQRSVFLYVTVFVGAVLAGAATLSLMITLFFPAIGAARAVAHKHTCRRNLERIAQALQAYEAEHGSLPPAYLADDQGVPMHSWRVLLLPYLGEEGLHEKYDFDQPWDGPDENKALIRTMPAVYACPSEADARSLGESNYMVVVGDETLFPGATARRTGQIGDDPSTTILVVESPIQGYPWTQPRDLAVESMEFAVNGTVGLEMGSSHFAGAYVLMADGEIQFLPDLCPPDYVEAMTTMSGNEPIPLDVLDQLAR